MGTQHWERLDEWQAAAVEAIRVERANMAEVANEARASFGTFAALPFEQKTDHAPLYLPPDGFGELLFEGLDLLKSPDLELSAIDEYSARLARRSLDATLPWISPLLRSTYHYRRNEYEAAFPFIKAAYERGCYCAGANQYSLLNQYIEIGAKNDKWREFTQGVRWATYLGFGVRWLRDKPQTEENLKFAYTVFQKAVYPVQAGGFHPVARSPQRPLAHAPLTASPLKRKLADWFDKLGCEAQSEVGRFVASAEGLH